MMPITHVRCGGVRSRGGAGGGRGAGPAADQDLPTVDLPAGWLNRGVKVTATQGR
jgi:hypothetical protein